MADSTPNTAVSNALNVAKQAGALWTKQPRSRKLIALAVVLGIAGTVAWTTLGHHVESWQVAIDGLAPDDAQELYAALIARGLPARIHEAKVEVKDGDMDQARAIAASAGLPFAGKGFELFDGNNLGQSSFTEQVNYRRALQGELARSITTLAQVESARVHLAIGKHSVFKDQEVAPSASVALHLHMGQTLTSDQVRGVRQLVASSLEGLKPEAVVILDGHGNMLDSHDDTTANRTADLEHGVADRVRGMLERVVGTGHVQVVATADLDTRTISETEDTYDKDKAVVRSESRTTDGVDSTAISNGIAGTRGALTGGAPATPTGSAGPNHSQETRNFEISHKVTQTTNPEATLRRLHVAVLVDEAKDKTGKPIERTKEQLAELTALARQAAGIDDARGDVIELRAVSFAPSDDATVADAAAAAAAAAATPTFELPLPLPLLAGAAAGALVLLTTVVMLLRRRSSRRRVAAHAPLLAFPAPVAELERALDARANGLPEAPLAAALLPGKSIQERVTDVVRADVERAAGVLTAWLAQTPAKGAK